MKSMLSRLVAVVVPLLASCSPPGSPMTLSTSLDEKAAPAASSTLYVLNANSNTVTVYKSPFTSKSAPALTVHLSTPQYGSPSEIAVAGNGTIFVANYFGNPYPHRCIGVYAPPYNHVRNVGLSLRQVASLTTDRHANLITSDDNGVEVFSPPYDAAPYATIPGSNPVLDGSDDLFVRQTSSVAEYFAPYYASPQAVIQSPWGHFYPIQTIAVNPRGWVFMSDELFDKPIALYKPPYKSAPILMGKRVKNVSIQLSALYTGDLFAEVSASSEFPVLHYAPPYQTKPKQIYPGEYPSQIVARDDKAFFANYIGGTVSVYAPPFDAAPVTITQGIDYPVAMAVTP